MQHELKKRRSVDGMSAASSMIKSAKDGGEEAECGKLKRLGKLMGTLNVT